MPPIPDPADLDTTTKQNYYSQLVNDAANQPSRMRRLIRSRGEITQGELKHIRSGADWDFSVDIDRSLYI